MIKVLAAEGSWKTMFWPLPVTMSHSEGWKSLCEFSYHPVKLLWLRFWQRHDNFSYNNIRLESNIHLASAISWGRYLAL